MIRAIVFDFDGVLVESARIKTEAFARLFEHEGQEVVARVVAHHLAHAGVSRFEKLDWTLRHVLRRPYAAGERDALLRRYSALVTQAVIEAADVPGAREFLEAHAARLPCYIASATPAGELLRIVRARGIERHFRGIGGAPRSKVAIVRDALAREGLPPADLLLVGDALADLQAARETGARFAARAAPDDPLFVGAGCPTLPDLTGLAALVAA